MTSLPTEDELHAATTTPDMHSMVVKAQSQVEATLRIAIAEALVDPHELEVERLSYPLKVDLAVALRAIRPEMRPLLLKLNRIRNEFAHNAHAAFSEQSARELAALVPTDLQSSLSERLADSSDTRKVLRTAFVVAYFEARQGAEVLSERKAKLRQWRKDVDAHFAKYGALDDPDAPHQV